MLIIILGEKQRGEDDFGGGEDEEDEDEAAGDRSIGEDGSSASSDEDVDGEIWKGDEDEEVERPIKAICMYAAIRPVANFQQYIQEQNANIIFGWNRHCDLDEDDDTSSQYEDPLECVICSAFCECLRSQSHAC